MTVGVEYESVDGVARVTLNRPEARNALNTLMRSELRQAMARADAELGVRAILLSAVDPVFCAGLDLREISHDGPPALGEGLGAWWEPTAKPVVGVINGAAITGGLEVALACDVLIGSDRASFVDTHAKFGLVSTAGLAPLLPRIVGQSRARLMSFTARPMCAADALAAGLLAAVVPHADLESEAWKIVTEIAGAPHDAVVEMKRIYDETAVLSVGEALQLETRRARAWRQRLVESRAAAQPCDGVGAEPGHGERS